MLANPVKQKLLAGKPSIGAWCLTGNPLSAEAMARAGFEWVLLDIEHYPIDVAAAANCFRAIESAGAVPFARLPANDPVWIKRFLDAAAMGIVLPLVRTPDDVRNAVEWARFPPLGRRPFGGGRVMYLHGRDDYVAAANDAILLLVQIETPEAADCLDEILPIPGVDGYFVGPTDLSLALGLPLPYAPSAERDELVRSLAARIRQAGKIAGTVAADVAQAAELVDQGFQFVNIAGDLPYVRNAASAAVADLRQRGLA